MKEFDVVIIEDETGGYVAFYRARYVEKGRGEGLKKTPTQINSNVTC